jgi:hypothetical protein
MDNKLGVIVPYRDRDKHLKKFLTRTKRYLKNNDIDYEIIIVNQDNAKLFNRGMLLNIGFKYAEKLRCNYIVFHDVDMLPANVDYSYSDVPIHLAFDLLDIKTHEPSKETFDEYFGGVTLFPVDVFKKINGYSNKYWGWGYEDTDLLLRCIKKDVDLKDLNLKNMGATLGTALKLNGINAYVRGKNTFNFNNNTTIFISFYPDELTLDFEKDVDEYTIFSIPGYDFSITYNSFSRYNFCTFDHKQTALYINSKIRTNYKTNITIRIDHTFKKIDMFQDGIHIGSTNNFKKLRPYSVEPFFYIGVANPSREQKSNFFKGYFDSLAIFSEALDDNEILEIANNKAFGLTQNFGDYTNSHSLKLYYDAKFIKDYKLMDLSGNLNSGEIFECEIVKVEYDEYKTIKIPHRREGIFYTLDHEENGFVDNKWKTQFTRWNQLRYYNEVSKNDDLLENDGLSDLEFVEHGVTHDDKITHINVGI